MVLFFFKWNVKSLNKKKYRYQTSNLETVLSILIKTKEKKIGKKEKERKKWKLGKLEFKSLIFTLYKIKQ